MDKWKELTLNAFFNISVALIVGGILRLVLDFSSIIQATIIFFVGAYLLFAIMLVARYIEKGE